jgi:hypothetical protein
VSGSHTLWSAFVAAVRELFNAILHLPISVFVLLTFLVAVANLLAVLVR